MGHTLENNGPGVILDQNGVIKQKKSKKKFFGQIWRVAARKTSESVEIQLTEHNLGNSIGILVYEVSIPIRILCRIH